jgi:hypothetical protein
MNAQNPKLFFLESFLRTPSLREIFVRVEGKRYLAYDLGEYAQYLGKPDIYYSIRSYENLITDTWDRVFFDVDAHDKPIKEAAEAATRVVKTFRDLGIEPTVIFTGRGFHVYIILSEPVELNIDELKPYAQGLGVDTAVLNRNPMGRLPFTINSKVDKEAVPVSPDDLSTPDYTVRLNAPGAFAEAFNLGGVVTKTRRIVRNPVYKRGSHTPLPLCIKEMLAKAVATGYLTHPERFAFSTFALRVWGFGRTMNFFKIMDDYDERVTRYQLSHIASRRYVFPKCRTMMLLGDCNEDLRRRCPFYPWLEPYLPDWREAGEQ